MPPWCSLHAVHKVPRTRPLASKLMTLFSMVIVADIAAVSPDWTYNTGKLYQGQTQDWSASWRVLEDLGFDHAPADIHKGWSGSRAQGSTCSAPVK
jgi:hypothetical protein